jgi:hypothetical protein
MGGKRVRRTPRSKVFTTAEMARYRHRQQLSDNSVQISDYLPHQAGSNSERRFNPRRALSKSSVPVGGSANLAPVSERPASQQDISTPSSSTTPRPAARSPADRVGSGHRSAAERREKRPGDSGEERRNMRTEAWRPSHIEIFFGCSGFCLQQVFGAACVDFQIADIRQKERQSAPSSLSPVIASMGTES